MTMSLVPLYRRWLKPLAVRAGAHDAMAGGFRALRRGMEVLRAGYVHLRVRLPPGKFKHRIGHIVVSLPARSPWQYERFRTLHNERPLLEDMVAEIRADDVVYDVGAYLGWHTCVSAAAASSGYVVAFEPHPVSYRRLCEVLLLTAGNATAYEYALADTEGTLGFTPQAGPGSRFATGEGQSLAVRAAPGDLIRARYDLPFPNVIKLDVEGAELQALHGLRETISHAACRLIYCEVHPEELAALDAGPAEVESLLEAAGFRCSYLDEAGAKQIIKATRAMGARSTTMAEGTHATQPEQA